jgi:hypothetical protein
LSLPFLDEHARGHETLTSSDLWVDCSSSERIFLYLDSLACSLEKVLVHAYVTFGAKYICACSGGDKRPCKDIHDLVMAEQGKGSIPDDFFEEPGEEKLLLEGPGCWHPTFPAPWYSIQFLASSFVAQFSRLFPDRWRTPWAFLVQNPWPFGATDTIGNPAIWFRDFP